VILATKSVIRSVFGLTIIFRCNVAEFFAPLGHQCRGTGDVVTAFTVPLVLGFEGRELTL
jgi:hypothetical protein